MIRPDKALKEIILNLTTVSDMLEYIRDKFANENVKRHLLQSQENLVKTIQHLKNGEKLNKTITFKQRNEELEGE